MSPIYICRLVRAHYPNLSLTIEGERGFDTAAVWINEEQDRKRHPSGSFPASCLSVRPWRWDGEESLKSNEVRACPQCELRFCCGTFLKDRFFLSAFKKYVIRRRLACLSLGGTAPVSSCSPRQWPLWSYSKKKSGAFVKDAASSRAWLENVFKSPL